MSRPAADPEQTFWGWLRYARLSLQGDEPSPPPTEPPPAELLQRLAPLLHHNLYHHGHADQLPEQLISQLRQETLKTISTEALYRNWLTSFGKRLAASELQAVLLKGSAFNGWLYADNTPRYSVDIDLWVHPSDFDQACTLMADSHQAVLLDAHRKATHQRLFERVFMPTKPGLPIVEIHRDLTNPYLYKVDALAILADSLPHPGYGNAALRTLSPGHNLLNLALHCSRDRDFANYSLLDAHELWCQTRPDADEMLDTARQWQACTPLFFLLHNAAIHMGTPIPQRLLDALQPAGWRQQLAEKTAHMNAASPAPPAGRLWQIGANFALSDRISNTLLFQWDYLKMRLADISSR